MSLGKKINFKAQDVIVVVLFAGALLGSHAIAGKLEWSGGLSQGDTVVRISHPDGAITEKSFSGQASVSSTDLFGPGWADGTYVYEVRPVAATPRTRTPEEFEANQYEDVPEIGESYTGSFSILNGVLVPSNLVEPGSE